MLTEKMIFVDTTATQFNLTDSMGSETSQPSDARSGPPRARRMSVPGKFPDKDLHALHLPSKNILIVEGSVNNHEKGHNVFGPCNVPEQVLSAFKATHCKRRYDFSEQEKRRIEENEGMTLKRLDVGVNLALPPDTPISRVLVELAYKMIEAGIDTSTYGYGETVYRNQHSQSSSHKFYDKAKQLYDTRGLPSNLPNRDGIMEFAKTVIRSEIVLRYPKMKVLEMTKPRDWTLAKLKAELVSAFDKLHLSGRVRAGLSALDLRDVKHMYRTTYRCWEHGDDLRVLLEPKALKRQIAYFESIGFDITTPPPVSGDETPLGDIFTLSNAVEPPPELWGDDDDAEAVEC